MRRISKFHIKVGDNVKIISGFHKNETGQVVNINKNTGKVIIKGINLKFKHIQK